MLVHGERRSGLLKVGWGYGRGVSGVCGEGAGWQEGDCDGEFGGEEEGEVEKAGPGDCEVLVQYAWV